MICWLEGDGHQVLESLGGIETPYIYLKIIGYLRTLAGRLTSGGRLPHWHYPVTQPPNQTDQPQQFCSFQVQGHAHHCDPTGEAGLQVLPAPSTTDQAVSMAKGES